MANPTAEEQLFLELVNEARLNPMASAARYISSYSPLKSLDPTIQNAFTSFSVNGAALQTAFQALQSVGPLAWNGNLADSAQAHSAAMIAADTQSHQVPGEADFGTRIKAAGYNYLAAGENVFAYGTNVLQSLASFMVDWGQGPNGMQSPAKHRENIMSASFTEIGIDVTSETSPTTNVGQLVVTQDFGHRGQLSVIGVAYNDTDGNNLYSIGEAVSGLTIKIDSSSIKNFDTGGYTFGVAAGRKTVTFSGGGLSGDIVVKTAVRLENVKLDIVNGNTLVASDSVQVDGPISVVRTSGVKAVNFYTYSGSQQLHGSVDDDILDAGSGSDVLHGRGGDDRLFGGFGNDFLYGGLGNDTLDGQEDFDVAVFSGVSTQYRLSTSSTGVITIAGPDGTDKLIGIEQLRFDDGQFTYSSGGQFTKVANTAPTVNATQSVAANEDAAVQVTVGATDKEGDALTYSATGAAHGTVTGGANGVFTYTPAANFNGSDSFVITVVDAKGAEARQTVNVTVKPMNDVPIVATVQAISTDKDVAQSVTVAGTDIDGDTLSYAAAGALRGTVSGGANGAFTYTPNKGFYGSDSFVVTVSDGNGGVARQTVNVTVNNVASPIVDGPKFRLFANDGFTGEIGGSGSVVGTQGYQSIGVADGSGSISFDASFNRGGDVIDLPGNASLYSIIRYGSSVELSAKGVKYTIPVGEAGIRLSFDDGSRTLAYDRVANEVKIGTQVVTPILTKVSAPIETSALAGAESAGDATAKVYLETGATFIAGGNMEIIGTNGTERVDYRFGDLVFDASFNKGGDEILLPEPAGSYRAFLQGSNLIIDGADGDLTIPVGTAGLALNFDGTVLNLRYDATTKQVMIGSQAITATTEGTAQVIGSGGGLGTSLDIGNGGLVENLTLAAGKAYTLIDAKDKNSNVIIKGFTADDKIIVSGAKSSDYSFTSLDSDKDGQADDLSISYNDGTVFNSITILDIVKTNGWVFDEQTAEQAVGYNFISFA